MTTRLNGRSMLDIDLELLIATQWQRLGRARGEKREVGNDVDRLLDERNRVLGT